MAQQVFEIGSSPAPNAATAAKRRPSRRGGYIHKDPPFVHNEDIIEIMDSDDEYVVPHEKTHRPKAPMISPTVLAARRQAIVIKPFHQTPDGIIEIDDDDDDRTITDWLPITQNQTNGATSSASVLPIQDTTPALPEPQSTITTLVGVPTLHELYDTFVARIIEVVPDVDLDYTLTLVTENYEVFGENVVEHVLQSLFEATTYPRRDLKGKRKRTEESGEGEQRSSTKARIDYASNDRPPVLNMDYRKLALQQLLSDFPYVPRAHIDASLVENRGLYAPTHILLSKQEAAESKPYERSTRPHRVTGKGKSVISLEFDSERAWVIEWESLQRLQLDAAFAATLENEETGTGIECACCFTDYPFFQLVQCPEAHLFCKDCIVSYASAQLGSQDANILCMDQSGCKLPIAPSELRRFLPDKLMDLYDRVLAQQSVGAAAIEGLEECPHCDFKYVIDNPDEKLFRCQNEDCLKITCRLCKKPDHLPKSCEEVVDDRQRDAQHAVDEAMTHALMRNCPKCHTAFIKENGCNKMTCPTCKTHSCYLCRKIIKGYDHFSRGSCKLHDEINLQTRHAQEVEQAAQAKIDELRRKNPEVDVDKVKFDVPQAGPARPGGMANVWAPMVPIPILQPGGVYLPPAQPIYPLGVWGGGPDGADRLLGYQQPGPYEPFQQAERRLAEHQAHERRAALNRFHAHIEARQERIREREAHEDMIQLLREQRAMEHQRAEADARALEQMRLLANSRRGTPAERTQRFHTRIGLTTERAANYYRLPAHAGDNDLREPQAPVVPPIADLRNHRAHDALRAQEPIAARPLPDMISVPQPLRPTRYVRR